MTTRNTPATPPTLPLPLSVPRESWPGLLEHAADAIEGRCIYDSHTLGHELRAIAAGLRGEVRA